MKKVLVALFALVLIVPAALSAEAWIKPLTSRANMRSFLVQETVCAYVGVYGEGVLNKSGDSLYIEGADALDIYRQINSSELGYRVVNARLDRVEATVQMYDRNDQPTFVGWKHVGIINTDNGPVVNDSEILIRMQPELVYQVPQDVSGINVITRDENGNQVGGEYCRTYTGQDGNKYITYQTSILGDSYEEGLHGEMVVQRRNDAGYYTESYDLSTGELQETSDVSMQLAVKIEGVETRLDSNVAEILPSVNGEGINTVFILTLTQPRTVAFKAKTSEGEMAIGVNVKATKGILAPAEFYYVPSQQTLPVGEYHVIFEWSNFHEKETRGPGWDYYGDGGMGKQ